MRRSILFFYFIGLSVFLLSCQGKEKRLAAELFFHTTKKSNFEISPNGKYISFLENYEGHKNLFVIDLTDTSTHRITTFEDRAVKTAFWANNDELIFLMDQDSGDSLQLMVVNWKDHVFRSLLTTSARVHWIEPTQVINNEVLISLNDRDSLLFDAYRLNIQTGQKHLVAQNPGNVGMWMPDCSGKIRLAVVSDGRTETILTRQNEALDFQPIIKSSYRANVQPLGFTAHDRDRIYALSDLMRDKLALVEVDLKTGNEMEVLYEHPEVDLNTAGYSFQEGSMGFIEFDTQHPGRYFFDQKLKDVFLKINNKIPDYSLKLIARDSLFTGFIIHASLDIDAGATYYYNYKEDRLLKLSEDNPHLNPRDLAPMKPISFYTRDGLKLSGYLTVPQNVSGKLPAIVIPPFGINSRAIWGYNPEIQFLVSRGYAVLQVNTRGIKGFGKKQWFKGFRNWGTVIQDDITDATTWLIREGIVDSTKIGIYGFSLGGYSALHSSCYKPNLYACAASYSGITNLFTYSQEDPLNYKPHRQMAYEMIGDPMKDNEYFRKNSPIFHTDKIKHPVFIIQGSRDTRSNVNETNQFVKDLRHKGIPVTYMLNEEEGHQFENEKNKISLYKELAAFFDKYLQ
jgi:dipeptidyl aminopeptidase/acylaminoacyl peptidase